MNIIPFQHLACPLDGEPLTCTGAAWVCANKFSTKKHSFDIAGKGYTNLLPVQNKRSLDPGDHKTMVAARQRFLSGGFYQPIANAVNQTILLSESSDNTLSCLDAGCGEGYYLRELAATSHSYTLALLGVDISKWAVLAAAKQDTRPSWIVGSNANLPVQSNTVDCVLCMFGFPVYAEFARVLKVGGLLLQVDAGTDHLRELRDIIYSGEKLDRATKTQVADGFSLRAADTVRYSFCLDSAGAIADLLAMTPHYYRASAEGRVKLAALTELTVTVDVQLLTYMRSEAM